MIFNTFAYFLLFLLPASWAFRVAAPPWRAPILAVVGAVFFIYFSLTSMGGVIGALCLGIFLWEAIISRLYRPGSRLCWLGVAQALLVLFVFKYWNFLASLIPQGAGNWRWASAFLPLGVSFFTFEFIHYAVDRQAGKVEAGTFWEYLAFILFFPTMVAGPIKRYQDFLPALRTPSTDWNQDWTRGCTRILAGLVKKFALADFLTAFTANLTATHIEQAERWVLVVWLLAFGIQIFTDFSAYSDIAIGSARLFGISVKENFDWPYLQASISGFWSHWHMSLTKWLTDYVFIPLGGSRVGASRVYINIFATMLVSGIWHGAGWNFLIWGLWHGTALCVQRWWSSQPWNQKFKGPIASGLSLVLTFLVVQLGWAWFVMDVPTACLFFRKLFAV